MQVNARFQASAALWCYETLSGGWLPTFRDKSVPSSRIFLHCLINEKGTIRCSETSASNHQQTPRDRTEERRPHLRRHHPIYLIYKSFYALRPFQKILWNTFQSPLSDLLVRQIVTSYNSYCYNLFCISDQVINVTTLKARSKAGIACLKPGCFVALYT
jgi:hypothetical protein